MSDDYQQTMKKINAQEPDWLKKQIDWIAKEIDTLFEKYKAPIEKQDQECPLVGEIYGMRFAIGVIYTEYEEQFREWHKE